MILNRLFVLLLILGLSRASEAWAQIGGAAREETVLVERVDVRFDGVKSVSESYVRGSIQVRAGDVYDQSKIDQSIRVLFNTRLFEHVDVDLDRLEDDKVLVTFVVRPKYKIETVEFVGNKRISDRRLRREAEIRRGTFLDEYVIASGAETLEEYYLKKGFSDIDIQYEVLRDRVRGTAQVSYTISEGQKIRVRDVEFTGNDSFRTRKLRGEMETRKWWIFSWLTGSGKFKEEEFQDDIIALKDFYKNEGFLDIAIDESEIDLNYPKPNRLEIEIKLEEGPRYYVGDMSFAGNTIFTSEELRRSLRLRSGEIFSPEKIDDAIQSIRDYYGSQGYLETIVRAERVPNLQTRDIDLRFLINESEKFFVESINIEGNTKTKSRVILRELALAPGDVFDSVRMRNSEERLKNTRFFDERGGVQLSPETTSIPGRKDLRIAVREGRTGNLSFGAGFSSLENAIFFAELTQGNFDLFNWRSGFQGDGQKFRLRLQLGSRSSEVVLAFEEPWLFEQRLAFGFEVYRRRSAFVSSLYSETRMGFEVYLRKRLFELVEARVAYGLEEINIDEISSFAPAFIRNQFADDTEDFSQVASKISLLLLRDTRNSLIFPTRGSRYTIQQDFVGGVLGGDVDYYKLELRGAKYFKLFDFPLEQSIAFLGRAGGIQPYEGGASRVPFYDRFFLGGPDSLRGFDYRDVSPYEDGEPRGGNSYAMGSIEYTVKIADPLRFAVFYDAGFVNASNWDFDPAGYNDNIGVGMRIMVLGAPLRLDYGIPMTTSVDNEDEGNQFHFSFGSRF